MTNYHVPTLPDSILEQEQEDFARAFKELGDTRCQLENTIEWSRTANPLLKLVDLSVFLAHKAVLKAEGVITFLTNHYTDLRYSDGSSPRRRVVEVESDSDEEFPIDRNDPFFVNGVYQSQDGTGVSQQAPSKAFSLSQDPTGVSQLACNEVQVPSGHSESPNPFQDGPQGEEPSPPYTSLPSTPSRPSVACGEPTSGVADVARAVPAPASSNASAPVPPSTPSCHHRTGLAQGTQTPASHAVVAIPSTPTRAIPAPDVDGPLTSLFPQQTHYVVTKGRRTGIYRSWTEAHVYVNGLPGAVYQGFRTFEAALDAYFRTRTLGEVEVLRGPNDTDQEFGCRTTAEDI